MSERCDGKAPVSLGIYLFMLQVEFDPESVRLREPYALSPRDLLQLLRRHAGPLRQYKQHFKPAFHCTCIGIRIFYTVPVLGNTGTGTILFTMINRYA